MERFLSRLDSFPKQRNSDHYNVPQRTAKTKRIEAPKKALFPQASPADIEVPIDFWKALDVFLMSTALSDAEKATLVAQFRQAHEEQIRSLSLDDFEDILNVMS